MGRQGNARNVTNCHERVTVLYQELRIVTAWRSRQVSSEYGVSHEPHLRKQLYFRSDLMQNLVTAVRSGLLLVAMSLIAAANLLGAAANGSLHGVVTDPSGARVVKATVTVQATDGTTS